jgi:hypothetical protein
MVLVQHHMSEDGIYLGNSRAHKFYLTLHWFENAIPRSSSAIRHKEHLANVLQNFWCKIRLQPLNHVLSFCGWEVENGTARSLVLLPVDEGIIHCHEESHCIQSVNRRLSIEGANNLFPFNEVRQNFHRCLVPIDTALSKSVIIQGAKASMTSGNSLFKKETVRVNVHCS